MESSKILIAFDLDGTINQTHLYALEAYKKTFDEMGVGPYSEDEIVSRFGASFEEDVKFFFENPSNAVIENYKSTLEKYWHIYLKKYAQLFPNVEDVLSQLKKDGHLLCICSNAPIHEIEKTLNYLGVSDYFSRNWGLENKGQTKTDVLRRAIEYYCPTKTIMVEIDTMIY